MLPGNPAAMVLGPAMNPESIATQTRLFGLDKPVHIQFLLYLKNIVTGKLGRSFQYQKDVMDVLAEKIGAVNTILNQDGVLTGYNSDAMGAVSALTERLSLKNQRVAIVGAGGAARAVGYGIIENKGNAIVVNRSAKSGEQLAWENDDDVWNHTIHIIADASGASYRSRFARSRW